MAQKILCPQCEKRYEIPDHPPAQATCKMCGTLMDLTAFGGSTRAPKPPAVQGATRNQRPSRRARRSAAPRQAGPVARREPGGGGGGFMLLLVGTLIVVLLVVVAVKRSEHEEDDRGARQPARPLVVDDGGRDRTAYGSPASAPASGTPKAAGGAGEAGRLAGETGRDVPGAAGGTGSVRGRAGKPRLSAIDLRTHPWPAEVDSGVRARMEEALPKLYQGGRDGVEAQEWIVGQGRAVCGRLINEFRAIEESPGFDTREGASRAGVIDGTLRRIDGQIERFWDERERVRAWGAFAAPSFITRIAKRWTWWWTSSEWKNKPRAPWDPFADESDETPDGMKPTEAKSKDAKKSGWGKRAGG